MARVKKANLIKKRNRKVSSKLLANDIEIYTDDEDYPLHPSRLNRHRSSSVKNDFTAKVKVIQHDIPTRGRVRRKKRLIINKTSNKAFGDLATLPPTKGKPGEK